MTALSQLNARIFLSRLKRAMQDCAHEFEFRSKSPEDIERATADSVEKSARIYLERLRLMGAETYGARIERDGNKIVVHFGQ